MGIVKREWVYQPHILTFFYDYRKNVKIRSFKEQEEALSADNEFASWCAENNCKIQCTWVECPDGETAVLFTMRWAV